MDENANKNWIIVGIGALLILVGGWWVVSRNQVAMTASTASSTSSALINVNTSTSGDSSASSAPTNATTVAEGDAVSVGNQVAGGSVSIVSVSLSKPGWVAIRDDRGWTLGAAWFDTGTHSSVVVPLLRPTEAGKSYQALLYIDTLGDHTFDLHGETLVTASDGSVAGVMFTVR